MMSRCCVEVVSGFWNELFSLIVRPTEPRRPLPGSLGNRSARYAARLRGESSMLLAEPGPCGVAERGIWRRRRNKDWSARRYSRSRSFLSLLFFSFSSFSSFLRSSSSRSLPSLLFLAPSQKPMTKIKMVTIETIGMTDGWSSMGCKAVV